MCVLLECYDFYLLIKSNISEQLDNYLIDIRHIKTLIIKYYN